VPDLADAADANFVTHAGWVQRHVAGMTVLDRPDLTLVDSGLPCDTFNFICRARMARDHAEARGRAAVDYFRQAQRPFSWWVGPADHPSNLGDVLVEIGLDRAESELAMAADLHELRIEESPRELRIVRVVSERQLRAFASVTAANWTPPDARVVRFYELAAPAVLDEDSPLWLFVAFLGDEPVATAELTVGGGVVGLYNISTRSAFRRRGFGTALTLHPLLAAREQGHRMAVLQAAPAGVSIYERVGFRPFGNVTEYKLPADGGTKVRTE
jgi:GNAT superfamily N-acetyltransferase